jgi:hypothetical protein
MATSDLTYMAGLARIEELQRQAARRRRASLVLAELRCSAASRLAAWRQTRAQRACAMAALYPAALSPAIRREAR